MQWKGRIELGALLLCLRVGVGGDLRDFLGREQRERNLWEAQVRQLSIIVFSTPSIMAQTKEQIKDLLGVPSHGVDRPNKVGDDEAASERMKRDIESSQDNALSLCTEKVLLARQAYDLIESHIKRLDEDLGHFAEDLKQEGKIPPDEPHILPPKPVGGKNDKRRHGLSTRQATKKFRERERERGMDFDLMPPPGSNKNTASMDADQMIDPNEPTYCICHEVSYGDMIACDNENCEGGEWFHYSCVGLTPETGLKGKWFCPTCRNLQ